MKIDTLNSFGIVCDAHIEIPERQNDVFVTRHHHYLHTRYNRHIQHIENQTYLFLAKMEWSDAKIRYESTLYRCKCAIVSKSRFM